MEYKRITLFAGHYGSGKTNIAVNYALFIKKSEKLVNVYDLDIVNPYFRTKDSERELNAAGVGLISSAYANSNVDVPALPAAAYAMLDARDAFAVCDVGGDDRGALALGRYTPSITEENNYELLFVINRFRPLTRTTAEILGIMREVERAAGMAFTAIVNNSNLGSETTAETVLGSIDFAEEVSRESGLPIKMTTAENRLCPSLDGRVENLFGIDLYFKHGWVL